MCDIRSVNLGDGGFRYLIPSSNRFHFYETEIIRNFQDGLHLVAHLSSVDWMDEAKIKKLCTMVADDLKAWK